MARLTTNDLVSDSRTRRAALVLAAGAIAGAAASVVASHVLDELRAIDADARARYRELADALRRAQERYQLG